MTTDNENRRHEHIYEMQILYKQRPHSDQELADRLGTDRTNIFRIRKLMNEQIGIPIEPDPNQRGRYFIPKDFTISHIPLNRIEAAQLYLAGRRLQQQTRTSQRPVVSALEKLAYALNKPLAERMVRAAEVVLDQEQDPQQEAIFATLVECWLDGIPVRITHRKLHGNAHTYRVHPYQLEPSVWGDGVYLIGHSEYHGKLATFKLTRIEKAVKGTGTFTIPEDFDIHELLNHAWGVWHADEEPQTVTLGFSVYVTPRLRESIWHPQQTLTVYDDGSSQWSAPVAEPREMIPWIRGWGADCEVKEPEWLWKILKREAQELAKLYGVVENEKELFAHFRESDRNRKEPLCVYNK
jgi:CRISPR-associated endonuclease/helicase Cas3